MGRALSRDEVFANLAVAAGNLVARPRHAGARAQARRALEVYHALVQVERARLQAEAAEAELHRLAEEADAERAASPTFRADLDR